MTWAQRLKRVFRIEILICDHCGGPVKIIACIQDKLTVGIYNPTTGLLDTLQYPVSTAGYQLKLQYAYQNGILHQISDVAAGTHYWTANAINPRGQYTQETLGNNVVVNHALDAVTGWVSSIQAGVGGGAALQNNSYLFDYVGNLTQRQDNNAGVTENVFPDNLYRLDHTVGDSSTVMSYDAMGRVSGWGAGGLLSNTKDYTTPQPGCTYYANSQPHAVRRNTQGANYSWYCYDANGNMSTENGCYGGCYSDSYAWTSYNQPSNISNSSNSSQFFYNADHQRYKQIASYNGSPETTFYVGRLLEKMVNASGTTYRHYIPTGNNTVLYTRLSTGANSTYYLTTDHLGSTAVITDSNGSSLVKEKFSALGWNENTSAEEATMAGITRHEFTSHEGLDNLSSVNMNGRIYQPSGSMFLSPDPYVPDPGNTQSFNRYSYVNNNPLSLVDPSGFDGDTLDEITVTASAIVDGVENFFGDIGSFFGGGSPHLSPYQQQVKKAGLGSGTLPSNSQTGELVRLPGYEQHYTIGPDGTLTQTFDPFSPENLTPTGSVAEILVTAPGYQLVDNSQCGTTLVCEGNLAGFAAGLRGISIDRALGQFIGLTAGGATIRTAGAGIGALAGGVGGYTAGGWRGVPIGALAGAATGLVSPFASAATGSGLAGAAGVLATGAASGAFGAASVNLALAGLSLLAEVFEDFGVCPSGKDLIQQG